MKIKFLMARLTILAACCLSCFTHAGIITRGYLTTDNATNFITDSLTGRLYTRFDAFSLSASETHTAVSAGGDWYGWSIATSKIADDFFAAALGQSTTPCSGGNPQSQACGFMASWAAGDFGFSWAASSNFDYFAYINTTQVTEVGIGEFYATNSSVGDHENWGSESRLTQNNLTIRQDINYLLYKDAKLPKAVPEPSTLAIFTLGMIGLASRRFKKQ